MSGLKQALSLEKDSQWEQALQAYQSFIQKNPQHIQALLSYGKLLRRLQKLDLACECFAKIHEIDPSSIPALNQLGQIHRSLKKGQQSEHFYKKALDLNPNNPFVLNNLGSLYLDQRRYSEAFETLEKSSKLKEDFAIPLAQMALCQMEQRHYDIALEWINQALQKQPRTPSFHFYKALVLFKLNEYPAAWKEYEWRYQLPELQQKLLPGIPIWKGEKLNGHKIWVHGEQGLGDQLMFSLFFAKLASADQVIVNSHPKLKAIFKTNFPKFTLETPETPLSSTINFQIPMGHLPALFPWPLNPLPSGQLTVSAEKSSHLKRHLQELGPGLKVGLSWCSMAKSSPNQSLRDKASLYLKDLFPLFKIPKIHWINLQYNPPSEQMKEASDQGFCLYDSNIDAFNDLQGLGALIKELDLVISINSTAGWLSAALNQKTWILNDYGIGNAFECYDTHSPCASRWFSNVTHFRQDTPGNWEHMILKIKDYLIQERDHEQKR